MIEISSNNSRLCLDQPEAHPGAEDDEGEGGVDLKQEEPRLPLKEKAELNTGVIPEALAVSATRYSNALSVAGSCQVKLSQGHLLGYGKRLFLPPENIVQY